MTNNTIVIVDPISSLQPFITRLRQAHFEVMTLSSQTAHTDLLFADLPLQSVKFALSGTDAGMAIALTINHHCGLLENIDPDIFYNKIAQNQFLQTVAPQWAFSQTSIFTDQNELKKFLAGQDKIVIRPEVSYVNGSAILYQSSTGHAIDKDINHLFTRANRLITHSFVEGDSYFINGVIVQGELYITDSWQCFNLLGNNRYILTSVISLNDDDFLFQIKPSLQQLCQLFGLTFSPIHFEIVKDKSGFKIVKLLPRLATEPLPTLCHLIDRPSQMDIFFDALCDRPVHTQLSASGFSADYSFIVRQGGHLIHSQHDLLRSLKSYHNFYQLLSPGSYLEPTLCGASYGLTVLFQHETRQQVMNDISYCQQLNAGTDFLNIRSAS